jgi:hypothetical protein
MMWPLLLTLIGAPLSAAPRPASDSTIVYYNARLALREGRNTEAARLWLLRNAIEDTTGRVSPHDADFHSVTWAALGALGICQDGLVQDDEGAGLWPLALHNYLVRTMGRRAAGRRARPFDAFEVGRQARYVAIGDVLGSKELAVVQLSRGRCLRPRLALIAAGEYIGASLSDRQVVARLLRDLLRRAQTTLAGDRVRGRSVIAARLFDLDLQLTALAAREARLAARESGRQGRQLGLSESSVAALRTEAPTTTLDPNSEAASILRACVAWPAREWMSLSPDRRLYLYGAARSYGGDTHALRSLGLGIIDLLIAAGDGAGVARWVGQIAPVDGDPLLREAVWSGERGQRLLALDPASGFEERAVIALHRGVDQLSRGDLKGALRSMAFARQHASESHVGGNIEGLSLRWLGYVVAQFEITDELLVTLTELVPRRDYSLILEDLMWSAAFHSDTRSFETGMANQRGRGALERRLASLRPLAAGDVRRFSTQVQARLTDSQGETLRFIDQFVARLEREDADVRRAQLPTLRALRRVLEPLTAADAGRPGRVTTALIERTYAIEEGVAGVPSESSAQNRARALSPDAEVHAGSVRLAPADPLPWAFRAVDTAAPSVFTPLDLVPEEWRGPDGAWVFGWSLRG